MKTVQGLSMNAIHHTEGYLSGNLKLTGRADKPNILGKVKFNKVGLEIAKTGSDFRNIDDEIDFTNRGIEFNRFKIKDKDGNALTVNGQVLTQTYRDFAFNLNVNAKDFKVVNSEKTNDAMMYGILAIDAGLRIREIWIYRRLKEGWLLPKILTLHLYCHSHHLHYRKETEL